MSVSLFLSYVCVCVYLSSLTLVRDRVFYLSRGNSFDDLCVCVCVCVYNDVFSECARVGLFPKRRREETFLTVTNDILFYLLLVSHEWSVP